MLKDFDEFDQRMIHEKYLAGGGSGTAPKAASQTEEQTEATCRGYLRVCGLRLTLRSGMQVIPNMA
jgi:hypothetical protein